MVGDGGGSYQHGKDIFLVFLLKEDKDIRKEQSMDIWTEEKNLSDTVQNIYGPYICLVSEHVNQLWYLTAGYY